MPRNGAAAARSTTPKTAPPNAAPAEGTPRGGSRRATTRAKLLRGARTVFERNGFHNARLADIFAEAGVSTGTFYNYYDSKEAIFRDLMRSVAEDLVERATPDAPMPDEDPIAGIEAANRAYVQGYHRNARLMSLFLQLAEYDPEVRASAVEMRSFFEKRLMRGIERWQAAGLAYADLDPRYAANALAYMVDRFLYEWEVLDLDYDEDEVVHTLNTLWIRGLGLDVQPRRRPAGGKRTAAQRPTKRAGRRSKNEATPSR